MTTGFILTRPINSGSVAPPPTVDFGVKRYNTIIPPHTTSVVDAVPFGTFVSAKWLVTVIDAVNQTMQSYEVLAEHLIGNLITPVMIRYGSIGNSIQHVPAVIFNLATTSLFLQILNNESNNITVHVARYELTDTLTSGVYGFGHKQIGTIVNDLSTTTVDSFSYTNYFSAKLLITLIDDVNTLIDSYEVVAQYLDGQPAVIYNRTSQIAQTTINHTLDITAVGGYIHINITNTHGSTISVSVARYDTT